MAMALFRVLELVTHVSKHDVVRSECLLHENQMLHLVIHSSSTKDKCTATLSAMDAFSTMWSVIAERCPVDMETPSGLSYRAGAILSDFKFEMGRDRLWLLDAYRNKLVAYKK